MASSSKPFRVRHIPSAANCSIRGSIQKDFCAFKFSPSDSALISEGCKKAPLEQRGELYEYRANFRDQQTIEVQVTTRARSETVENFEGENMIRKLFSENVGLCRIDHAHR